MSRSRFPSRTAVRRHVPRPAAWRRALAVALAVACVLATASGARAGDRELPVREVRDALRSRAPAPDVRPYLGVVLADSASGAQVARVVPGSPADLAGVRPGDVMVSVGARRLSSSSDLDLALLETRPGDRAPVALLRDGVSRRASVQVAGSRVPDGSFRGSVFRLAVVPLVFPDDRDRVPGPDALRRLLFDRTGTARSGASVADYMADQSHGRFTLTGEVLPPVRLPGPRARYAGLPMGSGEGSAFAAAAAALEARHGRAGLDRFDGVAFLYAGAAESRAGLALWPHRATVVLGGRRVPYYVHGTGPEDGAAIGVHCHEFGHLLGLADQYGAGHRTGCGDFCLMAIGHRGGPVEGAARPFSLCARCKLRLGWADPVVVDPSTPQRIRLRPVETAADQVVVVALDGTCSEYLLLEVRDRVGFDAELPSAGLLVWRTGCVPPPGQAAYPQPVDLVEAHGVDVFDASLVRTGEIAFPTPRARDLTPDTVPATPLPVAGTAAHLTDLRREPDGSVLVTIGVPRRVRQAPPTAELRETPDADGCVVRRDPVTGELVRFYVGGAPVEPSAPVPPSGPTGGAGQRR